MQKEVTYREVIAGVVATRFLRGKSGEPILSMRGALRVARLTSILERAVIPFQELEKAKYTEYGYNGSGAMPEQLLAELTAAQGEMTTVTFDPLDDTCFANDSDVTGDTLQVLISLLPFMEEQKDEK